MHVMCSVHVLCYAWCADCKEAHQLYQYAQSLGELTSGAAEEEREAAGSASFTDSMYSHEV